MTSLSDELALTLSARLQVPWEVLFDAAEPSPEGQSVDPPTDSGADGSTSPPGAPSGSWIHFRRSAPDEEL